MNIKGWIAAIVIEAAALIPLPQGQPVGPPAVLPPYGQSYSVVTPRGSTFVQPFVINGQIGWTANGPDAADALPIPAAPLPVEPFTAIPSF